MNQDSEIRGVARPSDAMQKYGALLLAAAVFFVIMAVPARTAHACSCVDLHLSEYADDVALAFAGRQIERILPEPSPDGVWSSKDPVTLVFEVERVYKGRSASQIALLTIRGGGSCGVDFGGEGVTGVAAFGSTEGLYVFLCGSPVTIAELQEVFGEGFLPDETLALELPDSQDVGSPWVRTVLAGGTLVILIGIAVVFLKRHRTRE